MTELLSIGDFSRMTFLSVKALRHYHDVGLLEPARIDPHSGYRYYRPQQVGDAQLIRRLRELDMPVDAVRRVVAAPDPAARDAVIADHLDRMTEQLRQTQETVDSLRRILQDEQPSPEVETVREPEISALLVRAQVSADEAMAWWVDTFTALHRKLRLSHGTRTGPDGVIFPTEFFTEGAAELVAYVPVEPGTRGAEPVPGDTLAVISYDGPFIDLDQAYGVLGRSVIDRAIAADGPVRERYLPRGGDDDLLDHTTVVCWPVVA
ncbi:MAG TPA: MerR family transcriptional regulator [Flexivirga sp.]|uniref:MerR family transcriptional regulator n=1 Tax=Flexivirga sp. TaxID=1962927 RepID=UPI002BCA22A0|nr:MerR family transcriptional regulator [Flexivirga sp.]HWC23621.1 MerR family transcriptional regulator [Flexivirga sp.]